MVTSAIAYLIAIILASLGSVMVAMSIFTNKMREQNISTVGDFLTGMAFLTAGYFCAYIGGI